MRHAPRMSDVTRGVEAERATVSVELGAAEAQEQACHDGERWVSDAAPAAGGGSQQAGVAAGGWQVTASPQTVAGADAPSQGDRARLQIEVEAERRTQPTAVSQAQPPRAPQEQVSEGEAGNAWLEECQSASESESALESESESESEGAASDTRPQNPPTRPDEWERAAGVSADCTSVAMWNMRNVAVSAFADAGDGRGGRSRLKLGELEAQLATEGPDVFVGIELTGDPKAHSALGLEWRLVGQARPIQGREIRCAELARLLTRSAQLQPTEWEALGIQGLRTDHYVKTAGGYWCPAQQDGGYQGVRRWFRRRGYECRTLAGEGSDGAGTANGIVIAVRTGFGRPLGFARLAERVLGVEVWSKHERRARRVVGMHGFSEDKPGRRFRQQLVAADTWLMERGGGLLVGDLNRVPCRRFRAGQHTLNAGDAALRRWLGWSCACCGGGLGRRQGFQLVGHDEAATAVTRTRRAGDEPSACIDMVVAVGGEASMWAPAALIWPADAGHQPLSDHTRSSWCSVGKARGSSPPQVVRPLAP